MKLKELKVGDVFRLAGMPQLGTFKLLHLSDSGCTVQPTRLRFREFITAEGKEVAFNAPGGKQIWSAGSAVEPVPLEVRKALEAAAPLPGDDYGEEVGDEE